MIKIIDNKTPSVETTLNAIPVGTVFYGEVQRNSGSWTSRGLFLKVTEWHGPHTIALFPGTESHPNGASHGFWEECKAVRNYQPVDIEIRVVTKGGA